MVSEPTMSDGADQEPLEVIVTVFCTGGEVCAWAGNNTASTIGRVHDSGRFLPAITAPPPVANYFNSLWRELEILGITI